ncbi:YukJ family protein [Aspergillus fijiensis CBS 313.89]|uniref:DUF2278 family protein n=1 Tax=Aspergillus fijiensis CBS 313.89 TaxID=1448319 RepID=A0A8G1RWE8_9EURO|nr:uncharacterized protein BO72DRAFT_423457 [Aspergillus fijiensis CBS 313.89]RAK80144.1 hypothetical protein BO72DRAFT_423457 [Aspergillus fijiensis CBS 313.89]
MPVPHYGVWVCKPTRYVAQRHGVRTPHIELYFKDDDSGRERKAAINVKSSGEDSRLVFWSSDDFAHPITIQLAQLDQGFHSIPDPRGRARDLVGLDYLRLRNLLNLGSGRVLPHDIPGRDNDILDVVRPILDRAIRSSAKVFIFGSSFGSGIHDVHMNQGSLPRYDNGVYQDGGLLIQFADGHWEAVFLAFASQRIPTDDVDGLPERHSRSLLQILAPREHNL